jgi:H/ACA ribonucleoprotein complex subunit 2
VVIAGDVSPMDVITHLPVLCEEAGVPYVYVPSKTDLGLAATTKRPTSVVMIIPGGKKNDEEAFSEYKKYYNTSYTEAKRLVRN